MFREPQEEKIRLQNYTTFIEKNLPISRSVQFKPVLFQH